MINKIDINICSGFAFYIIYEKKDINKKTAFEFLFEIFEDY